MASISQTTPWYIQGISEQPDQLKKAGQVRDALNVLPDVTDGLAKRPGGQYLNRLEAIDNHQDDTPTLDPEAVDMSTGGAWFAIDQTNKFIGRVNRDGSFAVWDATNGNSQTVSYSGAENLPNCNSFNFYRFGTSNIQTAETGTFGPAWNSS